MFEESYATVTRRLIPFVGNRNVEEGEVGRVIAYGYDTVRLEFKDGLEVSYPVSAISWGRA